MSEGIAQIIEDTLWEEHDNCEIKKGTYKECPAKCCYMRAAEAIEAEFRKRAEELRIKLLKEIPPRATIDEVSMAINKVFTKEEKWK